jgi:superfamily II DNA or RNA helicase
MPTGSGKTLVAVLLPYLLQATRVLVVTPSRIVRNQVHKEFSTLGLPKAIGALPAKTAKLAVKSVTKQVATEEAWAASRSMMSFSLLPTSSAQDTSAFLLPLQGSSTF